MLRDGVAHALSENGLYVCPKRGARVSRLGIVGGVSNGRGTNAKHIGPLLDFFPEVLRVERGITDSQKC